MPDKKFHELATKTGAVRLVKEPRAQQQEPPQPTTLPESSDPASTTGRWTIITEGKDRSAAQDDDSAQER